MIAGNPLHDARMRPPATPWPASAAPPMALEEPEAAERESARGAPGASFVITTEPCSQVLCRLLGLIAQQGRMIEHVEARRRRECLEVTLSVDGIDPHQAEIVAAKMRSLVTVRTVSLIAPAALA